MKTKLYASLLLIFSAFLFALLFLIDFSGQDTSVDSLSYFSLSRDSGFYDTDLSIEVSVPRNIEVYYTTDCSAPVPGSPNTRLYKEPIQISCTDEIIVHTLKFIAAPANNSRGETVDSSNTENEISGSFLYTSTYIVGSGVSERFHTLVISVSGDEDDLWGYENGIFTGGRLRQEYLDENPDATDIESLFEAPANYNLEGAESERPVTVQIFDQYGKSLLTQNCGIRIHGRYTRENTQKSFQLFARHKYDVYGNFHADLFPELRTQTDGTIISRNNRLLLRNSGQDFNHGFIRDALVQSLISQYGYPLASSDKPAAVFINGSYAGFYWLREPFSTGRLENLYGEFSGEFIKLSANEYTTTADKESNPSKEKELSAYRKEFQNIYDRFKDADFSDPEVYKEFCSLVDVESFLQYFAIETYIANKDWLYSNVKVYRYVSPDGIYEENSVFDGRYRYLLFDFDYSFSLQDLYTGYAWDEDNIAIISVNDHSPLWSRLMSRSDCRNLFIRYLCDIMNDVFSSENIKETLHQLSRESSEELSYFLEHSDAPDQSVTMYTIEQERNTILNFAENRPDAMHTFIQNDFPVFYPYTLSVSVPQNVSFSLNSITDVEDGFTGIYYAESGLYLKTSPDMGHTFSHYLINGEIFEEEELSLSYEDLEQLLQISPASENDPSEDPVSVFENTADNTADNSTDNYLTTLHIELIVTDKQDASPVISRIHYQNPDEFVELYNPCDHALSLEGIYLSSDIKNLKSMELPAVTLQSGESFPIYGEKNSSNESLGQHRLNFPLRKYETLYLSDHTGTILQQITIPDIDHPENDYVLNLYTGKFYEEDGVTR